MAYIARHHPLVSLEDVARGAHGALEPRGSRPLVAVTFDDGYLDNYVNAVPILLQERVPATFFVSTGHIGSERPFPHDLKKVGRGLPTMTWDHLRAMRAHGFTIGSHTVNHVDCARMEREALRAELAQSRDRLRAELGLEQVLFAYPFGRRDNMTPQALEVVKEVGFACCCSAYGGVNGRELDRFNLLRIGVNWRITPLAFRARLAGFQWEGGRADTRTGREPRVAHPEGGM
jgi:peptidoglycan/xylan/chitin deacetylase (PgdA/CDA1 family)